MPMPRVGQASSKNNGTRREWCPGSLEVLVLPRQARRTETLTGHAARTRANWETNKEDTMKDLNYELKQLCLRNRDGSFST